MSDMISISRLTAAIHGAFRDSDACHCHDDGKLSEDEFRTFLFSEGILSLDDLPQASPALAIDSPLAQRVLGSVCWDLRRAGVAHMEEFKQWPHARLLRIPGVGPVRANKIEKELARIGISLADGDPALIEQVQREKKAEAWQERQTRNSPLSDYPPEQLREITVDALLNLGEKANGDAARLMRLACRVAAGKKVVGVMKKYIARGGALAEEIKRFVAPLAQIEKTEFTLKKTLKSPPRRAEVDTQHLRVVGA